MFFLNKIIQEELGHSCMHFFLNKSLSDMKKLNSFYKTNYYPLLQQASKIYLLYQLCTLLDKLKIFQYCASRFMF